MPDCIFCDIINKKASADILHQDELVTAFRDIHPVAPFHVLIVTNKHIASVNDVEIEDEQVLGHLFTTARKMAEREGFAANGYRLIVNTGKHGGQIVYHLHMHLMGGQIMKHPIG